MNHSPEPFTNVALSLAEDLGVAAGLYLWAKHPLVMAAVALVFLTVVAWIAPRIYRALRAEWTVLRALFRHWFGKASPPRLTDAQERQFLELSGGHAPRATFAVIADLKGLRNAVGTLCLDGRAAVFFSRKWGRSVERDLEPVVAIEARRRLLVDILMLIAADGGRTRFDLLAGQLDRACAEAAHYPTVSPEPNRNRNSSPRS